MGTQMLTIRLKAHFDGRVIQLDEPLELPRNVPLDVTVMPATDSTEPVSAARHAEIDAWIREVSELAVDMTDDEGPRLQSAVSEIRRQARELARRGVETSP